MKEWISESMNEWWSSESVNELVNWWINESVNERPNGWWMDGWMSYVFVCLPASSSVAPILLLAQLLQLQCIWKPPPPPRIARAPQHHSSLARSQPNAFCQKRLETRIAGASRQIDQRSRSADNGGDSALLWTPNFFYVSFFWWNRALATAWSRFSPHLPKVARTPQFFNVLKCKSSSRYSPVRFLPTTLADRGPQPRKQRQYFGDSGNHFTRKKPCFAPENVSTRELTRFRTLVFSQLLDDGWLTWWCGWHDGVNANHDHRS